MSRKGDQRRDAIIAAAARLFWERGFSATSIADIAREAGVPQGNMFYYFRSKAELALAVADVFFDETQSLIAEAESSAADPRGRIRFLLQRLARSNRSRVDNGCPINAAVRDFRRTAPEASTRAGQSFELLVSFIARELQKTGPRPSIALARARAVVIEWQGGIALAHAFNDMTVLAESLRRAEQSLQIGS
ncbi:TetR family transcriptional regulator [Hoeflea sp. BAL378]|uniref:TetR/AcrR family transcriptional regulator n=1 Tax=Hoeflea sp. BAL378 TaxID=1547437 RepID=UPI000512A59A|nr:TetR/AcrR family transcriptional regulator [Hoeflea sp. BAL378]KGF67569.1 TetR family transcriptional regulator [Hoeflea sp. BAL378]